MRISRSFVLQAALVAGLLPGSLIAQNMPASSQNSMPADNNGQNQVLVDPGVIYTTSTRANGWENRSL